MLELLKLPDMSLNIEEGLLPKLPRIEELGLNRVNEGPPLPRELDIKWPKVMRDWMQEHWPGVPIPRKWGEEVVKRLPLGLGKSMQNVVDSLGL